ncbi:MULE transposase domain-containing protein [Ditylenchus destructor]|uniref:MULE transposase domain-containing protein n=1 Tax=Ditylenchus destructor TaxID=166010 RepID=A0AAD4MI93_9BILA|nr:MULE transposase domain-containing protein [Ditylenchus destructor]
MSSLKEKSSSSTAMGLSMHNRCYMRQSRRQMREPHEIQEIHVNVLYRPKIRCATLDLPFTWIRKGLAPSEHEAKGRCIRILEKAEEDDRVATLDELKEECKKVDVFNTGMVGICIMARKRPNSSLDTYEPLEEESSSDKENFDAPVEFIETQRQTIKGTGLMLAHDGHLYWHQKGDMEGSSFWKCVLSRKHKLGEFQCSTVLQLHKGFDVIGISTTHCHDGIPYEISQRKAKAALRKSVRNHPEIRTKKLVDSVISYADPEIRSKLGPEVLSRRVRRIRHVNAAEPANPKTLDALKIPAKFQQIGNEKFFLSDMTTKEGARVLMFGTERGLELMAKIKKWAGDGTFEVVPLLFESLWVLYVRLAHTFVPVLFCLMSNRVASTYISVLEKIKELRPDVNPQSFSLDFESAEIGAIRQVFPNTQLEGCFFHFQKAVLRYWKLIGLADAPRDAKKVPSKVKHDSKPVSSDMPRSPQWNTSKRLGTTLEASSHHMVNCQPAKGKSN